MNFKELCQMSGLGIFISSSKLTGGLMHSMYKIETSIGFFAAKILNPEVISRPEAYDNYIQSEKIASYVEENGINSLPAKLIKGSPIQKIEENYYMVFDYIEGRVLSSDELKLEHSTKIAKILADIHNLDYSFIKSEINFSKVTFKINWDLYLELAKKSESIYYDDLYLRHIKYSSLLEKVVNSVNEMEHDVAICHRDIDPKNVMWHNGSPTIIDWEAAGLSDPNMELVESAIAWSGFLNFAFDESRFESFISEYFKSRKTSVINWSKILVGNLINRFEWLEYNLRRDFLINSVDKNERLLAQNEVVKTIKEIDYYIVLIFKMEELIKKHQ